MLIGIDYAQPSSPFACHGLGQFPLDTAIETLGSFWSLTFLRGGGRGVGSRRNVPATFLWTKSINQSSLRSQ